MVRVRKGPQLDQNCEYEWASRENTIYNFSPIQGPSFVVVKTRAVSESSTLTVDMKLSKGMVHELERDHD